MKNLFVIFILLLSYKAVGQCNDDSERVVVGKEPLATELYQVLSKIGLSRKDGTFHQETFTYIGNIKSEDNVSYHVGYIGLVYLSSCRGRYALIFFDESKNIAAVYKHTEMPEIVGTNKLLIPYEEKPKTEWVFRKEFPEWLCVENDCFKNELYSE